MTAALTIEQACLTLGQFALRGIDLALETNEILVVLGPNGAGKSVLLETIAGFHPLAAGRITIGGREVTTLPPERRRVSLMFQNFGLFPHLTVAGNVAFGQRARHRAKGSDADKNIAPLLAQLGIAHLAERATPDLSPGERQRTALARALAARCDLFLFDEPFSALDVRTRDALRDDLKLFLRRAGAPAMLVSHDHTDAYLLADRVAVMHHGEIRQVGTVAEVFRRPADAFVADVIGMENMWAGRLIEQCGELWRVQVGERIVYAAGNGRTGEEASLCVRADEVNLQAADGADPLGSEGTMNRLRARVADVTRLGPICKVSVDCGFAVIAYVTNREVRALGLRPGGPVVAEIAADAVRVLNGRATQTQA